jgi:LysM repeat protein
MKSKVLIFFIGIVFAVPVFAQNDNLVVHGVTPSLHLLHTVQAKETWYSISRLYNINPKEMATSNGTTIDKPLAIGQQLKVPLAHANFSQDGSKAADEVFVPVYHVIQEKEWMYRISMNYNKVPIENLEKWNGINKDQAKAGLKIVVGYLKVKTGQSALAAKGSSKIALRPPVPVTVIPPRTEENKPVLTDKTEQPVVVKNDPPKEEPKTVTTTPVQSTPTQPTQTVDNNGGYFKSQFDENGKSLAGSAGIFKSTSGWNDGKYYALMNNVAVGTILKVNNPSTGKAVYAKVLGNLPDMKESAGLTIRISDAAATELGAFNAAKFPVDVKY